MQIDIVEDFDAFGRLRADWERVYAKDPEAQFFLSWTWLSHWLPLLTTRWFILVARPAPEAPAVAFFPLRMRVKELEDGSVRNEINMAGNYSADYTGLICIPGSEEAALSAFARHLRRGWWASINLENLRCSNERLAMFLAQFPERQFTAERARRVNERDNVDNLVCPFVSLPDDWERYLVENLSANARQKVRRFLRQVEGGDFRISHAAAETLDGDLKVLLRFWGGKWGARKGERLGSIMRSNYRMLSACFATGSLFLPVLWLNDRPLGALASLIDPEKRSLLFYIGGRDEAFSAPPPGLVLHAYSIRYAIAKGLKNYDFLRGNEPYKYSWGAQDHSIHCVFLRTRTGRNIGERLDPGSIPEALKHATQLHRLGRFVEARTAYRQILRGEPRNLEALYCLGQLAATRGDHVSAGKIFRKALAINPDAERMWLKLGLSFEARSRWLDASRSYRKIVEIRPASAVGHYKLGGALFRLRRFDEAVASFERALEARPDFIEAGVSRANTLHMLGRLPADQRSHYAAANARLGDKAMKDRAFALAIDCYRQASALDPASERALYGLGEAYEAAGDSVHAFNSFLKARELAPGYRDIALRLARLTPALKSGGSVMAESSAFVSATH